VFPRIGDDDFCALNSIFSLSPTRTADTPPVVVGTNLLSLFTTFISYVF